ncbi:hypothetical protein BGW41_006142 [Actinomortierella wolfii]|nr:hypothetical protein BGW41_006142 [Actinomortierella wolfii]
MDTRTKTSRLTQQHQNERTLDQEFHVIVHLPFKRPESFADHEVFWNADMEQTLWRLLGQVPPSAVDWHAVSRQLNNVPVAFLIRHAAYLYQIRLQDLHRLDEQHQQQLLQQQQQQQLQQQQQHVPSSQEDSRPALSRPSSKNRPSHLDKETQVASKSPILGGSVATFNPSGSMISARPPSISSSASTIRPQANPVSSSSVAPSPVIKNSNLPGAVIAQQQQQHQYQQQQHTVSENLPKSTRGTHVRSPPIPENSLHLSDSSVFPQLPHSLAQGPANQGQQRHGDQHQSHHSISRRVRSPPSGHQQTRQPDGEPHGTSMVCKEPVHPFNKATLFASQILQPSSQNEGATNVESTTDRDKTTITTGSASFSPESSSSASPSGRQHHHQQSSYLNNPHSHHQQHYLQQQHQGRSSMNATIDHSDRSSSMASTPFSQSNSTSQIFEETSFFNQLSSNDSLPKGIDGLLERALWDQQNHHAHRTGATAPLPLHHQRYDMQRSISGSHTSSPEETRMGLGLTGAGLSTSDARSPHRDRSGGEVDPPEKRRGGDRGNMGDTEGDEESEVDEEGGTSSPDGETENERLLSQQIKQLHLDEVLAFLPQGGSGSVHLGGEGGASKPSPRPQYPSAFAPAPPLSLQAESPLNIQTRRVGGGGVSGHHMSAFHNYERMPFQLDDELANLGTRTLEELSADDDAIDDDGDDDSNGSGNQRGIPGESAPGSDRLRRRGSRHHPLHHYQQHYLPRQQQSLSTESSQGSSPTHHDNPQQPQRSNTYNSVGSSFSDLSDSSITQSAMEDAYLSKFNSSKTSLFMHASTRN